MPRSNKRSSKRNSKAKRELPESAEATANRERLEKLLSFPDTDAGNAEAFELLHGHRFRYNHTKRKWMLWNSRYWVVDETGEADRAALDTARQRRGAVVLMARDPDDIRDRFNWALSSESVFRRKAMLKSAESIKSLATRESDYDRDPFLLTVGNGTLDLRTGTLLQFRPEDMVTRATDIPYDRDAPAPRWGEFLAEVFPGDAVLISFIQQAVGYSLTGDTKEQCLFILHGTGANGKTTFIETVRRLLGTQAVTTPASTLMTQRYPNAPRNDLAALRGARMAIASEAGQGATFDEALVKQLTGGDRIACRFLYGEFFEFTPQFKIWLATNNKPQIRETSDAIWRRIRLIPFTQQFKGEKCDPLLIERLKPELPGILAWAVRGCMVWQREGLGRPKQVLEATRDYRRESDQIGRFLRERCTEGPQYSVPAKHLYGTYQNWCRQQGEKQEPSKTLAGEMARRDYVKKRTNRGFVYEGLGFLEDVARAKASQKGE